MICKPPTHHKNFDHKRSVFLAGSIEMGKAENWQEKAEIYLTKKYDDAILIFNPRRDDWDSSWEQNINSPNFYEQVSWELRYLDRVDVIAMYFDESTISPISLLELGLYAKSGKMVVCCPNEFFRKGNIDIVCQKYGIPVFENFDSWLVEIRDRLID